MSIRRNRSGEFKVVAYFTAPHMDLNDNAVGDEGEVEIKEESAPDPTF